MGAASQDNAPVDEITPVVGGSSSSPIADVFSVRRRLRVTGMVSSTCRSGERGDGVDREDTHASSSHRKPGETEYSGGGHLLHVRGSEAGSEFPFPSLVH